MPNTGVHLTGLRFGPALRSLRAFTEVFDGADEEFGMHRMEQIVAERLGDQTLLLARFTGTGEPAR